jgi:tRNA dimethylallyltransferase
MKKLIVIAGPTASGKTTLAIDIATHFNTTIISADSRQCYKELNIGVAKPNIEELQQVEHLFINSHSIQQAINAADFEQIALQHLQDIFTQHDTAVMVGGTGLYIQALCDGIDKMPAIDENINATINDLYLQNGIAWLQQQVTIADPAFYAQAEIHNPARLIRALVFVKSHGVSIQQFKLKQKVHRDFVIEKYAIDMPKQILYDRINNRVNAMMQQGLLSEVQALLPHQHLKNLATVGYTELFSYLQQEISLDRAVELIKQNSRRYAKRQVTWFAKDTQIQWLSAENILQKITKNSY